MKLLKKTSILILALLMAVASLIGCNQPAPTPGGNTGGGGTGEQPIPATSTYLIKNGNTDYKIVVEPDAKDLRSYETFAAQEIKLNVEKASGAIMPVVYSSEVTVTDSSKLIIVGDTSLSQAANIAPTTNEFSARGFIIKTIGTNVYIVGATPMATLYGAYEFLHYQFGYEPYARDEIALETNVRDKKLVDFDLREIPDIDHLQATGEYWAFGNRTDAHRMRFNQHDEIFVAGNNQPWHNTFAMYVDPSQYASSHPKWYSSTRKQLHYTANGDPVELKALQDTVVEKMKAYIDADFAKGIEYELIGFMAQDGMNTFEADPAYSEKYGNAAIAAMIIHFINPVQEEITKYMEEKYDGKPMHVTFFAYVEAQTPPVVKDANGKWQPMDESVMVHPDANVFIAPIYQDYTKDWNDSDMKEIADGWDVLTNHTSFWFYDYYFSTCSMIHMDSIYSFQSYFQALYDMGAQYIFFEAPLGIKEYYVFGQLRLYLMSKLGWNVYADVDVLIDNFFTNYYKDAAPYMRAYFDSLTAYMAYLQENVNGFTGVGSGNINKAEFWQQRVLEQWLYMFDQAYEAIEPLKETDPALYQELYDRINYDSMSPRFLLLKHHPKYAFDSDIEFQEELASLKADAEHHQVVYWAAFGGGQRFADLDIKRG